MIDAGSLRERIEIFLPKEAAPSYADLENYEFFRAVWADVRPVTAREQMRSGLEVQSGQFTVRIRYLSGVASDALVRYRELFYRVGSLQRDPAEGALTLALTYDPQLNGNGRIES